MNVVDLILEKKDLVDKIGTLYLYQGSLVITEAERKIAGQQLTFMTEYLQCLEKRIALRGFATADQCMHY
jgi:hypothetical protein